MSTRLSRFTSGSDRMVVLDGGPAAWSARSSASGRARQPASVQSLQARIAGARLGEPWSAAVGEVAAAEHIRAWRAVDRRMQSITDSIVSQAVAASTASGEENPPATKRSMGAVSAAEKQSKTKRRRQQQAEKKRRLQAREEEERKRARAEEEFWFEASNDFVNEVAMEKAVAWRQERQFVRAWQRLQREAREVVRVEKLGADCGEQSATEEQTTEAAAAVTQSAVHGGWAHRLQWSDGLGSSGHVQSVCEDELGWSEVTAAVQMMQSSRNAASKQEMVIEQNPLYESAVGPAVVVRPVAACVQLVGEVGTKVPNIFPDTSVSGGGGGPEPSESVFGGQDFKGEQPI